MATATVPKSVTGDPFKPVQVPINEMEPKRRVGRPPLSAEEKERRAQERAARGGKERAPRRSQASLELRVGAMLAQLNFVFQMLPPTRNDALDEHEVVLLARAIDEQCRSSATFRKYVEMALSASSGGQFVVALGFIGARRMSRHGMLPDEMDGMLGRQITQMVTGQPQPPVSVESVQVEVPDENAAPEPS